MKPLWYSLINFVRTDYIRAEIDAGAILYSTLSNEIGLQFFKYNLSLFPFGIHVMTPCFKVFDNSLEPCRSLFTWQFIVFLIQS